MTALIVDDEHLPAKLLHELIKRCCFEIKQVDLVFSPFDALELLERNEYDLLFLDVEMPGLNGVELLKKSGPLQHTQIIFTTAYKDYAFDAFQANAVHYIVKPVEEEALIKAIRKATAKLLETNYKESQDSTTLSILEGEEYVLVNKKDVLRLEASGSYTKVVLQDKKHLTSSRLGAFEKKLDSEVFLRCHHSHIVNSKHVKKISKGTPGYLILTNEEVIPISKSKRSILNQILNH